MSTTNNKKELLAIQNTQQRGIITCLKQTTHRELLPVYNKQQVKELIPVFLACCRQVIIPLCYVLWTGNNFVLLFVVGR
jgi:hypothetical protein